MKRRNLLLIVSFALLAALIASCGGGAAEPTATPTRPAASPTPAATAQPTQPSAGPTAAPLPTYAPVATTGWENYERAQDRFALSLPPEWKQIGMDPKTLLAELEALNAEDPEVAAVVAGQAQAMAQAGVSFFGFDPAPASLNSASPTEVTVQRQPMGQLIGLDELVESSIARLAQADAVLQPVVNRRVQLAGGEAEEFRFWVETTDNAGNPLSLIVNQYLIVRRTDLYVITLSAVADKAEEYGSDFVSIAESFDFIPPARVDVSVEGAPMLGSPDAPVTIVEFSEFQCPYCARYVQETFPQIEEKYIETGKVKYYFRHFPLGFHENAQKAAEAAACVQEQGKFWEYHDALFANNTALAVDNLKQYAKDLGLDTAKFDQCLDSGAMASKVERDSQDGQTYGVSGTPAFFINGILVSGAQPYIVFEDLIEEELAR